MARNLQTKCADANNQVDNIVREANAEIGSLRDNVAALQSELQTHKRKYQELTESLQDKTRQHNKLQVFLAFCAL